MGDHSECFQVDFDPSVIAYEQLLDVFWASIDPTQHAWKIQYATIVLAHDDEQLAAARASGKLMEGLLGTLATRIEMLDRFWLAEGYHQKYYLRQNHQLMRPFAEIYPAEADFVNSTAAARVNGMLGTHR